jgi:hypothetical protein
MARLYRCRTYTLEKRDCISRHGDGVKRLIFENSIKDFIFIVSSEWRLTKQHFISQDSESPPINSSSVTLF